MKEYKDYLIHEAHTDDYDSFLLCFNHEGLMTFIDQVEEEPLIKEGAGKLLVDQLLVTGNGKNRFMLIPYDHGVLNLAEADIVEPDISYRKKSTDHLKDHLHLLSNSILMDQELEDIGNGKHI